MNIGVVIPAAGRGTRMKMGKNKMYLELAGHPLLAHTVDIFYGHRAVDNIVIVVAEDEMEFCRERILKDYNFRNIDIVSGGATRRESVFSGLQALGEVDTVLIHDGARPLLQFEVLEEILAALKEFTALTAGRKVKDAIKVRDKNNFVRESLDRGNLVAVSTPQAFNYELIMKAHRNVSEDIKIYDDASLVEELGGEVKIIEDTYDNIKITTPLDLEVAAYILANRREKNEIGNRL
ncbi:MAG: 2-C-methyl-D-erythritol 4-phosphate cytidylyltransferase [Halanaerobiaceae bacterium]